MGPSPIDPSTDTGPDDAPSSDGGVPSPVGPRRFDRASPWWSARAAAGALLVAAAAVGTYAAARPGPPPTPPDVVVAAAPVAPGTPLSDAALAIAPMAVPPELLDRLLRPDADLANLVAAAPLQPGDPILLATVADQEGSPVRDRVELALHLPVERALHGAVRPGEVLTLLGTASPLPDARIDVLSSDALVVSAVVANSAQLGPAPTVALVVALDPTDLLAVAAAHRSDDLQLVRAGAAADLGTGVIP